MTELLLASKRCAECLTTRNRVVPGERAAEIIRGCRSSGKHFECHKGSRAGLIVHCRGVADIQIRDCGGSTAYQFAARLGIPIREIDPDKLEA